MYWFYMERKILMDTRYTLQRHHLRILLPCGYSPANTYSNRKHHYHADSLQWNILRKTGWHTVPHDMQVQMWSHIIHGWMPLPHSLISMGCVKTQPNHSHLQIGHVITMDPTKTSKSFLVPHWARMDWLVAFQKVESMYCKLILPAMNWIQWFLL